MHLLGFQFVNQVHQSFHAAPEPIQFPDHKGIGFAQVRQRLFSPGRSTCAPLSLSVKMRLHPALFSARPAAIPDSGPGSTPGRSNPHRLEVLPLATNSRYSYRRGRNEKNESRMVFENLKATFLEHHTHTRFSRRCPSKDRRVAGRGANTFTSPISP